MDAARPGRRAEVREEGQGLGVSRGEVVAEGEAGDEGSSREVGGGCFTD